MTFGQGNSEAAKQHITPDAFKYDADKAKENVQQDVRRTATAMMLFVKTLAVPPALLSPAGNRALVTRSSKRLIKPNPRFSE